MNKCAIFINETAENMKGNWRRLIKPGFDLGGSLHEIYIYFFFLLYSKVLNVFSVDLGQANKSSI